MKTEGVKRNGYTMFYKVYEAGVDFEPTDDLVSMKTLDRYGLHDGYRVWRVEAALKRDMKTQFYYVAAVNSASAVNKFLTNFPWLTAIRTVKILGTKETDAILTNPVRYLLW